MHIERSFAHILDAGGMRRTTLRGWENLNKRFKLAAAFYNLSQLMRQMFGLGTPKPFAAALGRGLISPLDCILELALPMFDRIASNRRLTWCALSEFYRRRGQFRALANSFSSTGC